MAKSSKKKVPTKPPIPPKVEEYTERLNGFFGAMGEYHTEVKFLQTAISISDLDKLTLINRIPGSEKWGVRQLFQRSINDKRVIDKIVPYFLSLHEQIFFNPLTISVLPMADDGTVETEFHEDITKEWLDSENGYYYNIFEYKGAYKLFECCDNPQYSYILWNPNKSKLVAVDGQHRLSALKNVYERYRTDSNDIEIEQSGFKKWGIPLVITVMPTVPHSEKDKSKNYDILKSVRNIFITINKQAVEPSRTQQILVDDHSISAICVQEALSFSHEGKSDIPLFFYDWRTIGTDDKNRSVENDLAFMRVDELEDLHIRYLIGRDDPKPSQKLSGQQKEAFNVSEMDPELDTDNPGWHDKLRPEYMDKWFPVYETIIMNFIPTKEYITFIKDDIQIKYCQGGGGYKKHALDYLIYGVLPDLNKTELMQIEKEAENIGENCRQEKRTEKYGDLFNKAIGLRGVLSGFHSVYNEFDKLISNHSPVETAKWYINAINEGHSKGWLDLNNQLLLHVIRNTNDSIINYKLDAQHKALGAYCGLVAASQHYKKRLAAKKKEQLVNLINNYFDKIRGPIFTGYRQEVKNEILRQNPDIGVTELINKTQTMATKRVEKRINLIKKEFGFDDI